MSDRETRYAEAVAFGLDETKDLWDWSIDYQNEMRAAARAVMAVADEEIAAATNRTEEPA